MSRARWHKSRDGIFLDRLWLCPLPVQDLFDSPSGRRRTLQNLVAKFREKGATSPQRAMTSQELGLPPRFEEAMKRRLGATGIFVDVGGGRYYLNESRFMEVEGSIQKSEITGGRNQWNIRRRMLELRIARMALGVLVVALVLYELLYVGGLDLRYLVVGLLVVWLALTIFQLYWTSRVRWRMGSNV